jgi:hypothetical protein
VHPCIYKWTQDEHFIVLTVHVDDGIKVSNSDAAFDSFATEFCTHVKKATISRDFKRFLGMDIEIDSDNNCVKLSHSVYILERYSDFKRSRKTPMSSTVNLRDAEHNVKNDSLLPDTGAYRFIADRARPDILVATGEITTGGDKHPSDRYPRENFTASERIFEFNVGSSNDFRRQNNIDSFRIQ